MAIFDGQIKVVIVLAGAKHGDLLKPIRDHCRAVRDLVWQSLMAKSGLRQFSR